MVFTTHLCIVSCLVGLGASMVMQSDAARPRAREAGIVIGELPTGTINAITDVAGVQVGHTTLMEGDAVRTGVTVVLPHGGNLFQEKVPAAVHVGNAFGKLVGSTQVQELGNIESPIALTNTLNVWRVADALTEYMLGVPGNERVKSINVVVGETNDGGLNDIRGRHVTDEHVVQAIRAASGGPVAEGSVGAGTGTVCFGWKGGMGTSSRVVGSHTVGVLVQTNFGGSLTVAGVPVYKSLQPAKPSIGRGDGSCMIIVATDAPLDSRNLGRLAQRALAGMARTGSSFSNGSGDYVIAFSTAEVLRIRASGGSAGAAVLSNDAASPLFRAVIEATEEAILNSMFKATGVSSRSGSVQAIPIDDVVRLVKGGRL
jgi:D-aminopeptidase